MGLENKTGNRMTIVNIIGGKFTVRLPDGDNNPDAVERQLEKGPHAGQTVRELQYSHLDGVIVGGEMRTSEYGTEPVLNMQDGEEVFKLQLPVDGMYFEQIAKRLPNVDPTKNVVFGIGYDKERDRNFVYVQQDGASVHYAFTKDDPNGMPPPEKKTVMGKDKWDFTDQRNFLYETAVDFMAMVGEETVDPQLTEEVPF